MGAIHFSLDERLVSFFTGELPLRTFVETGTFHGDTLAMARKHFEHCHSIELSGELHEAAANRFENAGNVTLHLGPSPEILAKLAPRLAASPVFYWLDAHWCSADHTAGEDSQSPLLEEIRALAPLHPESVVLIDDARLYLSTPPAPHRVADWPDIHDIFLALRGISEEHRLTVFDDIMAFYPAKLAPALSDHIHLHAVDWLAIAGESRRHRARKSRGLRRFFRR